MIKDMTLPASAQSLTDAAQLAINNMEGGLEPLTTAEAQAFSSWLQAVYLSIFLHVDDDRPVSTLLARKIDRMAEQGISVLTSVTLSEVAKLARLVMVGFYHRATAYPVLDSYALFALAARLPLGPLTRALVTWVDIAYGNSPSPRTVPLVYFGVRGDGSLCWKDRPVVESFHRNDMSLNWLKLPAFWRVVYVVSKTALPYKGSADMILDTVVSISALPLDPYFDNTMSFPNYIAMLQEFYRLYATSFCVEREENIVNRLLQPWMGQPIRGARYAEDWLQWMQSQTLEHDIFNDSSIYISALGRLVSPNPIRIRTTSLEAIKADADPNSAEKPDDQNPDPDKTASSDTDTTDVTDEPNQTPSTDADFDTDYSSFPQETVKNNSIGNITLEKDSDPGRAYLYKRAVLALDDVLGRDPHIEIDQTARESLHLWCRDWLWLASVTQTESLIKALGLQKTLGLIGK